VDSGEDFDQDGRWDIFEDANQNLTLDPGEDLDGDGRLNRGNGCEGKEDLDCDGHITAEIDLSAFQVDRSLKTPYTDEWTATPSQGFH
jgi:hypothetical protein